MGTSNEMVPPHAHGMAVGPLADCFPSGEKSSCTWDLHFATLLHYPLPFSKF